MALTIQQISDRTGIAVKELERVQAATTNIPFNVIVVQLNNDPDYDLYMYLWRNLVYHYSSTAEQYELHTDQDFKW